MSIYSALNVGVTALQAQSNAINVISQNVSNANTTGYKSGTAQFATLLETTTSGTDVTTGYTPGGVQSTNTQLNDAEGTINAANSPTDLAISGTGFFAVSPTLTANSDDLAYTRDGTFSADLDGNYVNSSGDYLQAWPLDQDGSLSPSLSATNVDSATAIAALQTVNVQNLIPIPVPTTTASIQANLNSSETAYSGTPAYDATSSTANMASGSVEPDFTVPIQVTDSKGNVHELDAGFLKTANNTWAIEVYANPASDVSGNAQLAAGTATFNGDGSLASISSSLTQPIAVSWTATGAAPSSITVNWGTAGQQFGTTGATMIGRTDGLEQVDSAYKIQNVQNNGIPADTGATASVSSTGVISVTYSDGTTHNLYQIPLAQFQNDDQLQAQSANLFTPTQAAGNYIFFQPGQGEAATIDANSLESSNVDVASQLTNLIVAQNAYQANTKLITTSDDMLQTLTAMDVAVPD